METKKELGQLWRVTRVKVMLCGVFIAYMLGRVKQSPITDSQ